MSSPQILAQQNSGTNQTHFLNHTEVAKSILSSQPFEVTIEGTHSLVVPDGEAKKFASQGLKRVRLKASYEGRELNFHGALHHYQGRYLISFGKRYQKQLGVLVNDYFTLQLFEDTSKYGVEMPEEFQAVLESDPEAMERFEAFTPGKQRSLIYYIQRFKSQQTRIDKALMVTENMKMGITDTRLLVKDHR